MAINAKEIISCGPINIQSVGNKTFEIRDFISDNGLDILMLTETWLYSYEMAKITEMTPDTHTFHHVPRDNRKGGGVGIFVSNLFTKIKMDKVPKINHFEFMQVSCEYRGTKLTFVIVYRWPGSSAVSFCEEFRLYLESLEEVGSEIIIAGDFNFWVDDPENVMAKYFTEMMEIMGYKNWVNKPTSNSGHILDLIFGKSNSD